MRRPFSRRLAWLSAGALALRLVLAAGGWTHPERLTTEEDSAEYVRLGHNVAAGHGFSQSVGVPYEPDVRRTPVYPSVLAAVFCVPGAGVRAAAFTGAVASTLTVLATFVVASALVGSGAGWWAAVVLALDVTSATYATQVLTEPLFTLLLALSFVPLVTHRTGDAAAAGGSGLLSGCAALCRPIAIFSALALAPACRLRAGKWSRGLALAAVAIGASAAPTALWMARNYAAAGAPTVSSVAATNMYFHRAAYVEAWRSGTRVEDVRDAWQRDFEARAATWNERERVQWMTAHGRGVVLAHPLIYALVSVNGALRMLRPDTIVLSSVLGGDDTLAYRLVHAAAAVQLGVIYAAALYGFVRLVRCSPICGLVPLAPIVYFLLIGGPEMYPRFRVPLMPFVSLLAASAWTRLEPA